MFAQQIYGRAHGERSTNQMLEKLCGQPLPTKITVPHVKHKTARNRFGYAVQILRHSCSLQKKIQTPMRTFLYFRTNKKTIEQCTLVFDRKYIIRRR